MQIKTGRRYVMRNGDTTGLLRHNDGHFYCSTNYPFIDPENDYAYTAEGYYFEDGSTDRRDLVREAADEGSSNGRSPALVYERRYMVLDISDDRILDDSVTDESAALRQATTWATQNPGTEYHVLATVAVVRTSAEPTVTRL